MKPVLDISTLRPQHPTKASWTAVVPAAGRGTRLGFEGPKVLYPVEGKPILHWLVEALQESVAKTVFVLAPGFQQSVETELQLLKASATCAFETAIQIEPLGMADAVDVGLSQVKTPNVVVLWGDQVSARKTTIQACQSVHEARGPAARLTLPSVIKSSPYIHFERDSSDRLVSVTEQREGTNQVSQGETDCGLFCFSTPALRDILTKARTEGLGRGAKTGEFNLLPLLPLFEQETGSVVTLRVGDLQQTVGINTASDAEAFAKRKQP